MIREAPCHFTCISCATDALRARRHPHGYWEGRLASSPLATAVALCALSDEAPETFNRAAAAEYLRKTQNPDGGWGDTEISKSNLAATLLALCANACATAGLSGSAEADTATAGQASSGTPLKQFLYLEQRTRAESYVEKLVGLDAGLRRVYGKDLTFQVPIRMTAAYSGLRTGRIGLRTEDSGLSKQQKSTASATSHSVLSPQSSVLSSQSSVLSSWLSVDALPFELAAVPRRFWAAVSMPVVSYAVPALVCVGLARHAHAPSRFPPLRWLRNGLAERALKVALEMQPASGGYLEATPITAFCLIGLKAAGRGAHEIALNARRFLVSTQRPDGSWPVEVNLSVWNTTRAIDALAAGGLLQNALSPEERAATRDWLLAQQSRRVHPYTGAHGGGWGWNHLDGSVPDADDTAGALLALRHLGVPAEHPALQAGKTWLLALQNADGGWPTFCRGWQRLPFDKSAPDLTAHALRALQALGETDHPACTAGWAYLSRVQRPDGSFAPLWFGCEQAPDEANAAYGTTHVLFACEDGRGACEVIRERALAWLRSSQNPDGGFGGCKGARSTAEETGLALRALVASGARPDDAACARAARWLMDRQRPDGSWDPAPIGFYFAVLWYYEELYPLCYALGGWSAWAKRRGAASGRDSAARPTVVEAHAVQGD